MSGGNGRHAARRAALAARLGSEATDGRVDALLVTDLVNVRYLTGFTGSNGAVLVWARGTDRETAEERADLVATDGRYLAQIAEQVPDLTAEISRDTASALLAAAARGRARLRIGVEGDAMSIALFGELTDQVREIGADLIALRGAVEALRTVKDADEVELITSACRIGDRALGELIARGAIAAGRTEREVARDLEWQMYADGADAIAFETIVATGANSAIPHHRPTDAVLAVGDLVKIDFGAVSSGYHSDMTRTFVLGEPQEWQREIHRLVQAAQKAGREALVPGTELAEVDAAARRVIADAGYGEYYVHGLGHGVGLQIHEGPGIGAAASGTLPVGATVTVEPGIYLPGRGGVRIEDTLVVTDDGPRLLTTTPRALRAL
ncbi:aminopeptidase P family protein [Gordonia sp. (in: high G+C Gram-positive bacteria)]|uniref:aminopeptidase P family protein n=1 Tax=Gordonia sp. (in: high G+C Gram-positive bacteria) TaxID=84139 RepID=UPI003C73A4DE